jgi:UDP-N-acetylmuramoyl-L-alanyl-D-glutamate--2,6-diaminopimelate ligase
MKTIHTLINSIQTIKLIGDLSTSVIGIEIDSRKAVVGSIFVAINGVQSDGHLFINKAIESGAVAIVCESLPVELINGVTYIQVANSSEAVALMAASFYDHPSSLIKLVGVTGTNGKTTIATLLFKLFRQLGYTCGLISTVQNQINDTVIPATHTTPDVISLNALLQRMVNEGCTLSLIHI